MQNIYNSRYIFATRAKNTAITIFFVEFVRGYAIIHNGMILNEDILKNIKIDERIGEAMAVSYKRLWKLLIDRDMKKKDLAEKANLSSYTINKMNRGDNVTTDTLVKICTVLNCTFDDIMEMVPDEKS